MKLSRTDLAALAVVTIWGVNFALLKLALDQFDAFAFTWARFAGMLALAWIVAGRAGLRLPRADLARVIVVGVAGYTGYITLSIVGLSYTTAFSNALLIAAAPVFSVALLIGLRAEALGRDQVLGVSVAVVGVLVFLSSKVGHWQAGLGDLISLAAAALYAAYTVLLKPLLARHPARVVIAWTMTAGGIPVLAITTPSALHQDWAHITSAGWVLLAWATVVPIYGAWTAWAWIVARAGVARTNAFIFLVPVVGGVASLVLTGEAFGWAKLVGAAVVLAGLVLIRRQRDSAAFETPEPVPTAKAA